MPPRVQRHAVVTLVVLIVGVATKEVKRVEFVVEGFHLACRATAVPDRLPLHPAQLGARVRARGERSGAVRASGLGRTRARAERG